MLVKRSTKWKLESIESARQQEYAEQLKAAANFAHRGLRSLRSQRAAKVKKLVDDARQLLLRSNRRMLSREKLTDYVSGTLQHYHAVRAGRAEWPSDAVWDMTRFQELAELDARIAEEGLRGPPPVDAKLREIEELIASEMFYELRRDISTKRRPSWVALREFSAKDPRIIGMDTMPFEASPNVWVFRGICYEADPHYPLSANQVLALITEVENNSRLKVEKAMALLAMRSQLETSGKRQKIPQEVKLLVWQRDKGRCVECSSQAELEFDHIIPLALGGSNSDRNLQLLCGVCNRRKGATLG